MIRYVGLQAYKGDNSYVKKCYTYPHISVLEDTGLAHSTQSLKHTFVPPGNSSPERNESLVKMFFVLFIT